MNNVELYTCIAVIVIASSINPYIKKTIVTSKNNDDKQFPYQEFYIFVSFVMTTIISYVLCITNKDCFYLGGGIIMTILTGLLFKYKIYKKEYESKIYRNMIISSFLTVIPSFLFVYLITKNDISALDPIIKPLILILIFIIGVVFYDEQKQNTIRRWLCIVGIVILIGVFKMK